MTTKKTLTQRFEELSSKARGQQKDEITDLQEELEARKGKLFRTAEGCREMGDEALEDLERYDKTAGRLICSLIAENEELKVEKKRLWEEVTHRDAQIAALQQTGGSRIVGDENSELSMVVNPSVTLKRTKVAEPPSCYIYLAPEERSPLPTPAKKPPPLVDVESADIRCFNCLLFGHKYTDCVQRLRTFCRVCGKQGVSLPNCPNRCKSKLPARGRRSR